MQRLEPILSVNFTIMHEKKHKIELFFTEVQLQQAVLELAQKINQDFKNKKPLFLVVLNGAFMFASDLLKKIYLDCEISFIKLSSYQGTEQKEQIQTLLGLNEQVEGKEVIILEDIVDTGNTVMQIQKILEEKKAQSITVAAMFFKPKALVQPIEVRYVGLEIGNEFIYGYGLDDAEGKNRNLNEVYRLIKE